MNVKIKFLRQAGKATLSIDASELHEYLRALGITESNGTFVDEPYAEYREIDTYRNRISTKALLNTSGPITMDLATHYGRPVGLDTLQALADTAGEVVREVVDHYRPIDISVVIAGKRAV